MDAETGIAIGPESRTHLQATCSSLVNNAIRLSEITADRQGLISPSSSTVFQVSIDRGNLLIQWDTLNSLTISPSRESTDKYSMTLQIAFSATYPLTESKRVIESYVLLLLSQFSQ